MYMDTVRNIDNNLIPIICVHVNMTNVAGNFLKFSLHCLAVLGAEFAVSAASEFLLCESPR